MALRLGNSQILAALRDAAAAKYPPVVRDLARRGVSIAAFLDLYDSLGRPSCMPHFDPELSTTRDVVRSGVIHVTVKDGLGLSYADT